MTDSLIKNLRDLATFAHADLSVADEAADEIERLREALREISTRNFPEGTATLELRKIARAALGENE